MPLGLQCLLEPQTFDTTARQVSRCPRCSTLAHMSTGGGAGRGAEGEASSVVTATQVVEALAADKGCEVLLHSWTLHHLADAPSHYGSLVLSLQAHYSQEETSHEAHYIVKINPNRNLDFSRYVSTLFTKEVGFYELSSSLNSQLRASSQPTLSLPRCLATCLDQRREVIIFEDLRIRGYRMFDGRESMDASHASLVVQELARLHAASHLLQTEGGQDALHSRHGFLRTTWWNYREGAGQTFTLNMEGHLDLTVSLLQKAGGYERAVTWLLGLKPRLLQLVQQYTQVDLKFSVICHADCTSNNFLFRYDERGQPTAVALIDFQMCLSASLATDLAHFLFCCLDGPVRKANVDNLLALYHNTFRSVAEAAGVSPAFTVEELREEYNNKLTYGALMAMLVVPVLVGRKDDAPEVASIVDDMSFLRQQQDKLAANMDENSLLRPRFLSIFDELLHQGVIP